MPPVPAWLFSSNRSAKLRGVGASGAATANEYRCVDGGLDGTPTYYSMNNGAMPPDVRRMWALVAEGLEEPLLQADRARCAALLRERESESAGWPDAVAGQMERHYSPGRTWEAMARGLLGLVRLGDVLDAGSGDGSTAALLAPRARSITCLDRSPKVLEAARRRLAPLPNVTLVPGDLHALPFSNGCF